MGVFEGWTIVRHSAFYTQHTEFTRAVESASFMGAALARKIEKAGGLVFPSYEQAEAFAEKANYPPDHTNGIIPNCQGTFTEEVTINGRALYIPVRAVVG